MKSKMLIVGMLVAVMALIGLDVKGQDSKSFNVHDRVGNGWHMYTTVYLGGDGSIAGNTTLKNYNNFRGYTGGVFVVALDENDDPVYTTGVHKWGINSSFFKKKVERNVEWNDQIPEEYLPHINKIAVMQMHTPTNRVLRWAYDNRQLIIAHAVYCADLFRKIKSGTLTPMDVFDIINKHL